MEKKRQVPLFAPSIHSRTLIGRDRLPNRAVRESFLTLFFSLYSTLFFSIELVNNHLFVLIHFFFFSVKTNIFTRVRMLLKKFSAKFHHLIHISFFLLASLTRHLNI